MKALFLWLSRFAAFHLACAATLGQSAWTLSHQNTATNDILWSLVEGNAGVVAVGDNGIILHSLDARTWVRRNSGTSVWLVAVTYGRGLYVAVGDHGTVLTSPDAIAWSSVRATGTTARLNNVLYAQDKFVAVGESGVILVSSDAHSWVSTPSGISTSWLRGLAYANGDWIATGQRGAIVTSMDGLVWQVGNSGSTADFEAVVATGEATSRTYADGSGNTYTYFLAVGEKSTARVFMMYKSVRNRQVVSTSFSHYEYPYWQLNGPSIEVRLRSLSMVNGVFVASGEDGAVFAARGPYGPWARMELGTNRNLVGAGAALGSLMLVGVSETIFRSEQIFLSRLGNIATRGVAGPGAATMIAGTYLAGTRPKQILVRGIGPTLSEFGVAGVLPDPVLAIYDSRGYLVSTNSGWGNNPNPAAIATAGASVGAFPLAANSRDAALLVNLSPGAYTFQLGGAGASTGNSLIEAYDLDPISSSSPRAINISTRGQVGVGDDVLIAGIVVQGQSSRTLLVRGVGPALAQFGVSRALANPLLRIFDSTGALLATNDNWEDPTITNGRTITADEVSTAAAMAGAFALSAQSRDAATIINLVPGNYTVQVTGVNNTTGLALVEVYDLPRN